MVDAAQNMHKSVGNPPPTATATKHNHNHNHSHSHSRLGRISDEDRPNFKVGRRVHSRARRDLKPDHRTIWPEQQ
ncbi:unnamed protein product [Protopolystoma xenopodis]|uniref:Uncharacterized protein n=1 Tax=Protopolystoma xenopodis TaxID=117903 RepID=A0A448X6E0_9PLAT|nr:unnamed protein product [Protopolystoma xenopodis]